MGKDERRATVFFDGVCNFCHQSVMFIVKRDRKGYFRFASLQSRLASVAREKYSLPETIDSLILIEQGKAYTESTAALRIARRLDGIWKAAGLLLAIPPALRDPLYRYFAKNRYRWFGKRSSCLVPTADIKDRFLSMDEKGDDFI